MVRKRESVYLDRFDDQNNASVLGRAHLHDCEYAAPFLCGIPNAITDFISYSP